MKWRFNLVFRHCLVLQSIGIYERFFPTEMFEPSGTELILLVTRSKVILLCTKLIVRLFSCVPVMMIPSNMFPAPACAAKQALMDSKRFSTERERNRPWPCQR